MISRQKTKKRASAVKMIAKTRFFFISLAFFTDWENRLDSSLKNGFSQ